jgi:hypothetical protein
MNDLINIVPEKHRSTVLLLVALSPFLTRAYHSLRSGGGIRGVVSAIWFGTNTPTAPKPAPDDPRQGKLPITMLVALCAIVAFTGCHDLKPPANAIVGGTARKIGIMVGQNQASQTPEVTIGFYSFTYHRVPTGSNITAPPVRAGIRMDQSGFSTDIVEEFTTGAAAVTNSGKVCEADDDAGNNAAGFVPPPDLFARQRGDITIVRMNADRRDVPLRFHTRDLWTDAELSSIATRSPGHTFVDGVEVWTAFVRWGSDDPRRVAVVDVTDRRPRKISCAKYFEAHP